MGEGDNMEIGQRIRYLRRKLGLSQNYIAEKLGYKSYTTIQKWETGEATPPLKKLTALADLLQVDISELTQRNFDRSTHADSCNYAQECFKTVGQRIRNRRIQLGLSVDELAVMLNKNRATVYRYESNEIEKLPISILKPLSKALRTTPSHLIGWEDVEGKTASEEVIAIAQTISDNKELHKLFDVSKDASPEDITTVYKVMLALRRKEDSGPT